MQLFFKNLFQEIKEVTIPLYKILIPFIFIIKFLEEIGAVNFIAKLFEPTMKIIGLPAELGIILVTAIIVNIYAALILFVNLVPSLDLTVAQITILTVAMLLSHNLPVESTISKSAGVSFWFATFYRIILTFIACWILNFVYVQFDYLSQPFVMTFTIDPPQAGLVPWFKDQLFNLIYVFGIIVVMVTFLEILKVIGVEQFLRKILTPPLKLFGISDAAMNIIIVGITLGLQFGGGILIKEVNSGKIDKQSVFLSILMINLIHALFEDTLLMLLVGGHYSGVVFGRIFFGLVFSLLIFKFYQNFSSFFEKYVFDQKLRLLPSQKIN
ncbi:MAG: nucleoside recognition protein [Pelagibacteraceae bacterium]